MTARKPRQAIIYCRISDDREGREYGVDRQEAHCRKLAARRGWHVAAVLVDNDITGTGRKQRPGYDRLLDMLRDGTANVILAVSDKRLNRNYRNAFALLDLIQERDIAVEFTKGGPINMNTAEGAVSPGARRSTRRRSPRRSGSAWPMPRATTPSAASSGAVADPSRSRPTAVRPVPWCAPSAEPPKGS